MSPAQDDILDELYFVTVFSELKTAVNLPEEILCQELHKLLELQFVKCFFPDPDTEVIYNPDEFAGNCRQYFYLATKKGLLAHNSR